MKKALIISFSHLNHDARVRRQIEFLQDEFEITTVAFDSLTGLSVEPIIISAIRPKLRSKLLGAIALVSRKFEKAYEHIYRKGQIVQELDGKSFDLVIANDVETLPIAAKIKGNAKLIFDAHEYAPRHFEDRLIWRLLFKKFNTYLCERYIPRVNAMLTVSEGLAREYKRNFGVDPVVITNASSYYELQPAEVDPNHIKIVHHGAANPSRKIELMIELARLLDKRFSLDLILLTPASANRKTRGYLRSLQKMIDSDRINILPPVNSLQVVPTINQYDIGLFLLPPTNFNYQNALPNKLYDFIQARLAIAIGPTPEMAQIVKQNDLGIVANDFHPQTLAKMINNLTAEDISRFKANAANAALRLSSHENKKKLLDVVQHLFI